MDLKTIQKKFKSGSWLRKLVGANTYNSIQEITEFIIKSIHEHNSKIEYINNELVDLENRVLQLESEVDLILEE